MFDIGSSLREARTRQGLDFEEMESRTKVRAKYLRFLEEERFEQLPGHTYTKGFLRVYADALGLDGGLYVDEYNSRYVGGEDDLARLPKAPRPSDRRRDRDRARGRGESRTVVVALAAILVLTALVIAAWRFGGDEAPRVQGVNAATPTATKNGQQQIKLVIKAVRGSTFMEVRAGGERGAPLYTGTLERGQTQRFTRTGLYLVVARPRSVVLRVNGQPMRLPASGRLAIAAATAVR
jgi:transcriptional regulator with XRE-family HTH domain